MKPNRRVQQFLLLFAWGRGLRYKLKLPGNSRIELEVTIMLQSELHRPLWQLTDPCPWPLVDMLLVRPFRSSSIRGTPKIVQSRWGWRTRPWKPVPWVLFSDRSSCTRSLSWGLPSLVSWTTSALLSHPTLCDRDVRSPTCCPFHSRYPIAQLVWKQSTKFFLQLPQFSKLLAPNNWIITSACPVSPCSSSHSQLPAVPGRLLSPRSSTTKAEQ